MQPTPTPSTRLLSVFLVLVLLLSSTPGFAQDSTCSSDDEGTTSSFYPEEPSWAQCQAFGEQVVHPSIQYLSCVYQAQARKAYNIETADAGACIDSNYDVQTASTFQYGSMYDCIDGLPESARPFTMYDTQDFLYDPDSGLMYEGPTLLSPSPSTKLFLRACDVDLGSCSLCAGQTDSRATLLGMDECSVAGYAGIEPICGGQFGTGNQNQVCPESVADSSIGSAWDIVPANLTNAPGEVFYRIHSRGDDSYCLGYYGVDSGTPGDMRLTQYCADDSDTSDAIDCDRSGNSFRLNIRPNRPCLVKCAEGYKPNATLVDTSGLTMDNASTILNCSAGTWDLRAQLCGECDVGFTKVGDLCLDRTTLTPILTLPASSTRSNALSINYTLPESALGGTVELTFIPTTAHPVVKLTLVTSYESAGVHAFTPNPANLVHAAIAATTSSTLPSNEYTVVLSYNDSLGNPAATASSTGFTLDTVTEAPTLLAPKSSISDDASFSINYTLPETPLTNSVKLIFNGTGGDAASQEDIVLTLAAGVSSAGSHAFDLNAGSLAHPNVASITGPTRLLSGGLYNVTLEYQDDLSNPAASATSTNVEFTGADETSLFSCTLSGDTPVNSSGVCMTTPRSNEVVVLAASDEFTPSQSGTATVTLGSVTPVGQASLFNFSVDTTNSTGPVTLSNTVSSTTVALVVYDTATTSQLSCAASDAPVGSIVLCTITPRKSGAGIYSLASQFTPSPAATLVPSAGAAASFEFNVTNSTSQSVTVTDGLTGSFQLTFTDTPDNEAFSCPKSRLAPGENMTCSISPTNSGSAIFATKAQYTPAVSAGHGAVSGIAEDVGSTLTFVYTASAAVGESGPVTLTVGGGGNSQVSLEVVATPTHATLSCNESIIAVGSETQCTLVPKIGSTTVYTLLSEIGVTLSDHTGAITALTPSAGTMFSFNFSASSTSHQVTFQAVSAADNSSLAGSSSLTVTVFTTANGANTVCTPAFPLINEAVDCFVEPQVDGSNVYILFDQLSLSASRSSVVSISPAAPSNNYSFSVLATADTGPIVLSNGIGDAFTIYVTIDPDNAVLTCPDSVLRTSSASCTIMPRVGTSSVYASAHRFSLPAPPQGAVSAINEPAGRPLTFTFDPTGLYTGTVNISVVLESTFTDSETVFVLAGLDDAVTSCTPTNVEVGQTSVCTITPYNNSHQVFAASSDFTLAASAGSVTSLSPEYADQFAFNFTAPQNGTAVTISNGVGADFAFHAFHTPDGAIIECNDTILDLSEEVACTLTPTSGSTPVYSLASFFTLSGATFGTVSGFSSAAGMSLSFTYTANATTTNQETITSNLGGSLLLSTVAIPDDASMTCTPTNVEVGRTSSCTLMPLRNSTVIYAELSRFTIATSAGSLTSVSPSSISNHFTFNFTAPQNGTAVTISNGVGADFAFHTFHTPDGAIIECNDTILDLSEEVACTLTPTSGSTPVYSLASFFTLSGATFGTVSGFSSAAGTSLSFTYTANATTTNQETITSNLGGSLLLSTVAIPDDASMTCTPTNVEVGRTSSCTLMPLRNSAVIYAELSRFTIATSAGSLTSVSPSSISNHFTFNFTAPQNGTAVTISNGVGADLAFHTFHTPDGAIIECNDTILDLSEEVACTLTPTSGSTPVYSLASFFTLSGATFGTVSGFSSAAGTLLSFTYTANATTTNQETITSNFGGSFLVTTIIVPSNAQLSCSPTELRSTSFSSCTLTPLDSQNRRAWAALSSFTLTATSGSLTSPSPPTISDRFTFFFNATFTGSVSINDGISNAITLQVTDIPTDSDLSCSPRVVPLGGTSVCTITPIRDAQSGVYVNSARFTTASSHSTLSSASGFGTSFEVEFTSDGTTQGPVYVTDGFSNVTLFVVDSPDASSELQCSNSHTPVDTPLSCWIVPKKMVNGSAVSVWAAASVFDPNTVSPNVTVNFGQGDPAGTRFDFNVTAGTSQRFTLSDSLSGDSVEITSTITPDASSSLVCTRTTLTVTSNSTNTETETECTHTPRRNGVAPVFILASSLTVSATPSVGTLSALSPSDMLASSYAFTYTAPMAAQNVSISDGVSSPVVINVLNINGCLNPSHPCFNSEVTCTDAPEPGPEFSCGACPSGLEGNGITCTEINSCDPNPCFQGGECTDIPAPGDGFVCANCTQGYVIADGGVSGVDCIDFDACATNPCPTGADCTDLPPPSLSFSCGDCPPGETVDESGNACVDINECDPDPCSPLVNCTDVPAPGTGFNCSACPMGYVSSDGSITCTDFDACASAPCFGNLTCVDDAPPSLGFDCGNCPEGYVVANGGVSGVDCIDFDSCAANPCFAGVTCVDDAPPSLGRQCGECPTGYEGDGVSCSDIDACEVDSCFRPNTCIDNPPPSLNFSCPACPESYVGDGIACLGIVDQTTTLTCTSTLIDSNTTMVCTISPRALDTLLRPIDPDASFDITATVGMVGPLALSEEDDGTYTFTFQAPVQTGPFSISTGVSGASDFAGYVIAEPDETSIVACNNGRIAARTPTTCTFVPQRAGAPIFAPTSLFFPITVETERASSSLQSVQPNSTATLVDPKEASGSIQVTFTALTSGIYRIQAGTAELTPTAASIIVTDAPDATTVVQCPVTALRLSLHVVCDVTARRGGLAILAELSSLTLSVDPSEYGTADNLVSSGVLGVGPAFTFRFTAGHTPGDATITSGPSSTVVELTDQSTAPETPGTPRAWLVGARSVLVDWSGDVIPENIDEAAPVLSQHVEVTTNPEIATSWSALSAVSVPSTNFTVTSLISDTRYFFRIRSTNRIGTSPPSPFVNVTTPGAPRSPTDVSAVDEYPADVIRISWGSAASHPLAPVTRYTVFLSPSLQQIGVVNAPFSSSEFELETPIDGSTFQAFGTYRFIVVPTNEAGDGDASSVAELTLASVPSQPTMNPPLPFVSSVLVSWTSAADNGRPITSYNLQRSLLPVSEGSFTSIYQGTELSFNDAGRTSSTQYAYRVAAINVVGDGAFTEHVVVTTLVSPPSAPRALSASNAEGGDPRAVVLSWTPPEDPGSVALAAYRIEVAPSGTDPLVWSVFAIVDDSASVAASSVNITLLMPKSSTGYSFRISARNSGSSFGATSTSANVMTAGAVPRAPTNPSVEAGSTTSSAMRVSWQFTADSSNPLPVTSFRVRFHQTSESSSDNDLVFSSQTTSVLANGLEFGTQYTITVRAINSAGDGAVSAALQATTSGLPPSGLSTPTSTTVSDTSITLEWAAPASDGRLSILGYRVQVMETNVTSSTSVVLADSLTHRLTQLRPSVSYSIRVGALNSAGWSEYSGALEVSTLASAPVLTSVFASDPDNGDAVFSVGDVVTLTFDVATDRPPAGSMGEIAQLLEWQPPLESDVSFTGSWLGTRTLNLRVTSAGASASSAPRLGVHSVAMVGGVKTAAGDSAGSTTRLVLTGSWGDLDTSYVGSIQVPSHTITLLEDSEYSIPPSQLSLALGENTTFVLRMQTSSGYLRLTENEPSSSPVRLLELSGSRAEVNAQRVTYRAGANYNGPDAISLELLEGSNTQPVDINTMSFNVAPVNDAPTLSVPSSATITVDGQSSVGQLSVVDLDSVEGSAAQDYGDITVRVVLSDSAGSSSAGRLTFTAATGTESVVFNPAASQPSSSFTLRGALADVNTALSQRLRVDGSGLAAGTALSLLIVADDNGNVGEGEALTASATVPLTTQCEASSSLSASVVSAQLTDSYGALHLQLDRPVRTPTSGPVLTCSELLDSASMELLVPSACALRSDTSVSISLGQTATVAIGDTVALATANPLTVCGGSNAVSASGSVSVLAPASPLIPKAVINAPSSLGACDNLVVDGSSSVVPTLGVPQYVWSIVKLPSGDSVELPSSVTSASSRFTLSSALLEAGSRYRIELVVVNSFGVASDPVSHLLTKSSAPLPLLTPVTPTALTVSVGQAFTLEVLASASPCTSAQTSLSFSWRVWNAQGSLVADLSGVTSPVLQHQLSDYGEFSYQLMAVVSGTATNATLGFVVTVERTNLVAAVAGGAVRTLSTASVVALDASGSRDPDGKATLNFAWSCASSDSSCVDVVESGALTPNSATVQVAANVLSVGTYAFTVRVTTAEDSRQAEASTVVVVVDAPVPIVTIELLSSKIVSTRKVRATSMVTNTAGEALAESDLSYSWSISGLTGTLDNFETDASTLVAGGALVPGSTLLVRLEVVELQSGATAYAEASVDVYEVPSGGFVSCSPDSGVELTTTFTCQAQAWTWEGDSTSLTYSFWLQGTVPQLLAPWSRSAEMTTKLPAGAPVNIMVRVRSSAGTQASASTSVTVTAASNEEFDSAATTSLESARTTLAGTQDVKQALSTIALVSAAAQGRAASSTSALAKSSLSLLSDVVSAVSGSGSQLDGESVADTLESVTSSIAASSTGDDEDVSAAIVLLDQILSDGADLDTADASFGVVEQLSKILLSLLAEGKRTTASRRLLASEDTESNVEGLYTSLDDIFDSVSGSELSIAGDLVNLESTGSSNIVGAVGRFNPSRFAVTSVRHTMSGSWGDVSFAPGSGTYGGASTVDIRFALTLESLFTYGTGAEDGSIASPVVYVSVDSPHVSADGVAVTLPCDTSGCTPSAGEVCECECWLWDMSTNVWTQTGVSTSAPGATVRCTLESENDGHMAAYAVSKEGTPPDTGTGTGVSGGGDTADATPSATGTTGGDTGDAGGDDTSSGTGLATGTGTGTGTAGPVDGGGDGGDVGESGGGGGGGDSGVIIGAVIGSLVGLGLLAALFFFCHKKYEAKKLRSTSSAAQLGMTGEFDTAPRLSMVPMRVGTTTRGSAATAEEALGLSGDYRDTAPRLSTAPVRMIDMDPVRLMRHQRDDNMPPIASFDEPVEGHGAAATVDPDSVPPGWTVHYQNGIPYYANTATGEVRWTLPSV